MRPKERRETGQSDLLRSRLDSIIDMNHALVKLARTVDWGSLEERFGAVYSDKPGQPPLPTRLMALEINPEFEPAKEQLTRFTVVTESN